MRRKTLPLICIGDPVLNKTFGFGLTDQPTSHWRQRCPTWPRVNWSLGQLSSFGHFLEGQVSYNMFQTEPKQLQWRRVTCENCPTPEGLSTPDTNCHSSRIVDGHFCPNDVNHPKKALDAGHGGLNGTLPPTRHPANVTMVKHIKHIFEFLYEFPVLWR